MGHANDIERSMPDQLGFMLASAGLADNVSVEITAHDEVPEVERDPQFGPRDLQYLLGDTCLDATTRMTRSADPRVKDVLYGSTTPAAPRFVGYHHLPMTQMTHAAWFRRTGTASVTATIPSQLMHSATFNPLAEAIARQLWVNWRSSVHGVSGRSPLGHKSWVDQLRGSGLNIAAYNESQKRFDAHFDSAKTPGEKYCEWSICDGNGMVKLAISDIISLEPEGDDGIVGATMKRGHSSVVDRSSTRSYEAVLRDLHSASPAGSQVGETVSELVADLQGQGSAAEPFDERYFAVIQPEATKSREAADPLVDPNMASKLRADPLTCNAWRLQQPQSAGSASSSLQAPQIPSIFSTQQPTKSSMPSDDVFRRIPVSFLLNQ